MKHISLAWTVNPQMYDQMPRIPRCMKWAWCSLFSLCTRINIFLDLSMTGPEFLWSFAQCRCEFYKRLYRIITCTWILDPGKFLIIHMRLKIKRVIPWLGNRDKYTLHIYMYRVVNKVRWVFVLVFNWLGSPYPYLMYFIVHE